jgi:hypothetical protein
MKFLISHEWRTREEDTDLLRKKHGWQLTSIDAVLAVMARIPGMTQAP